LILVTVGTARDFSRLIKKIDEIGRKINEKIIIQRGNTKYMPKNCVYFDFTTREKFENYVKKANIVVTHGGVGSIITSLNFGKPTIVVPRREKYNEHKNDHQMDIAKELGREGKVLACYDIRNLKKKIDGARKIRRVKKRKDVLKIEKTLERFIESV